MSSSNSSLQGWAGKKSFVCKSAAVQLRGLCYTHEFKSSFGGPACSYLHSFQGEFFLAQLSAGIGLDGASGP
jgi:hypothetical protein